MFGFQNGKREVSEGRASKTNFWSFAANTAFKSQGSRNSAVEEVFPPRNVTGIKQRTFFKKHSERNSLPQLEKVLDEKTFHLPALSHVNERYRAFELMIEQEEVFESDLNQLSEDFEKVLGMMIQSQVLPGEEIYGLKAMVDAMIANCGVLSGKVKFIPSMLLENWLWKTLSETFSKYFAIADSFMESLVQDSYGSRNEDISLDRLVTLLLKPFIRPMWYRFFLQQIVSNVPSPTEDLLFALTHARGMASKAMETKKMAHYDHFDEICALESMFDGSMCQSLEDSKAPTLKITTYLSKPTTMCFSPIPFSQRHIFSANFREIQWTTKKSTSEKNLSIGDAVQVIVLTCVLLVSKMDETAGNLGLANLLEIKLSQQTLIVLQGQIEKDKHDLLSAFKHINTLEWDQTPDIIRSHLTASLSSIPPPLPSIATAAEITDASAEEPAVAAVTEIFRDVCRPYMRDSGNSEWEQLPKADMFVVSELDGSRPRITFTNAATARVLGNIGVSVATKVEESEPRGVLLNAFPFGSKTITPFLIRFKSNPIRDDFMSAVSKGKSSAALFLHNARKNSLLIEDHGFATNFTIIAEAICTNLTLTSLTSIPPPLDSNMANQRPMDLGPVRLIVKEEVTEVGESERRRHVIEIVSTVNESVAWLRSPVLDDLFRVEASLSRVDQPTPSIQSASDGSSTISSLRTPTVIPSTVTLIFSEKQSPSILQPSSKRYRLSFSPGIQDEHARKIADILDRSFVPPSPLVELSTSTDDKNATFNMTSKTAVTETRSAEISPSRSYPLRPTKSTGDLVSSTVSHSRGVTGWVAERVAYFNELARRTAAATQKVARSPVHPYRPQKSGKVLARWKAAMENVRAEMENGEEGMPGASGVPVSPRRNVLSEVYRIEGVALDARSAVSTVVNPGLIQALSPEKFTEQEDVEIRAEPFEYGEVKEGIRKKNRDHSTDSVILAVDDFVKGKSQSLEIGESAASAAEDSTFIAPSSIKTSPELPIQEVSSTIELNETPYQDFVPPTIENHTQENDTDLPMPNTANPPTDPNISSLTSIITYTLQDLETLHAPFSGTEDQVDAYLATRWWGIENETREKLDPPEEFPEEVKRVWESMPYSVQVILARSGLERTEAGRYARSWLNTDRNNIVKFRPDYVSARPGHIQGPLM
ncbi:hypothetical protein HDU67_006226 [Dinochytrium kinnereticum]|nr:hypothetical protein HDU67_006226 [Dinochytrium kinnereticum]